MPYLNVDLDYFAHRKTVRLCARLGAWAEMVPLKLWAYVGKHHAEDGLLIGYEPSELFALAGIRIPESCNANSMLIALLDIKIMDAMDGGWVVHEWLDHQGHIAAFAIRGRNNANKRWAKLKGKRHDDATSITKGNAPTLPSYPTSLQTESSTAPLGSSEEQGIQEAKRADESQEPKADSEIPSLSDLLSRPKGKKTTSRSKSDKGTKEPEQKFEHEWIDWEPLGIAWAAWLDMRRKKKVPNTEHAKKLAMLELIKCSEGDPETAVKIIDKSTFRGWAGFFPLKGDDKTAYVAPGHGSFR